MNRFKQIKPHHTSDGFYIFAGELRNGNYFVTDSRSFSIKILNDSPLNGDRITNKKWQEEHFIKELDAVIARAFSKGMLQFVIEKKPDGNYSIEDIKTLLEKLENQHIKLKIHSYKNKVISLK